VNYAIETQHLRKEFGAKVAVKDLTLRVPRGEVFGFLGPNGAGKSTSMKMMLSLMQPTSGQGIILGQPLGDTHTRAKIGFLPEHFRFQDWLTGREFLRFHARMFGMRETDIEPRIEQLLVRVDMLDAGGRQLRQYSKGMLQRIGLAQALLNRPHLVFLDEPTSGLDPIGRLMVRDIINEMRSEGTTVFLNSHLLSEVEVTCDRVVFIRQGEVVREVDLRAHTDLIHAEMRLEHVNENLLSVIKNFANDVTYAENVIHLTLTDERVLPRIVAQLVAHGAEIYSINSAKQSLESMFIEALGDQRAG